MTSELVAGYVDGRYKWSDADWALHAGKVLVRIAVDSATNDGHVLDVETGDATPDQAVGWVIMRRAGGFDPTCYTGEYAWPALRNAFIAAGVIEPHYWLAHYGAPDVLPDGVIALQNKNAPLTGGHYDSSIVADHWPGVDEMDDAQIIALINQKIAEYGQRLQAELDDPVNGYEKKADPEKPHSHAVTGTAS